MSILFVDGNANYPSCRCTAECEMPCWQLVGLTDDPCGGCGCDPFDYQPAVIQVPAGSPIPEGYVDASELARPERALPPGSPGVVQKGERT